MSETTEETMSDRLSEIEAKVTEGRPVRLSEVRALVKFAREVEAIHQPDFFDSSACFACSTEDVHVAWPCQTAAALNTLNES